MEDTMDRREFNAGVGCVAVVASPLQAFARFRGGAYLDHAVPGVGLTVNGSPREVKLYFDIGVIAAYSNVQIISPTGAMIAASKPANDPSDQQVVLVRLKRALPPGTYMVSWQVVSIHGRPTSGTFRFTVA
jgi:methionine-rich copper-binding protein CopC